MSKLRSFPTKSFINHELFWCISNVVISTDNMRNLHIVVINNYRKVVSWVTIFLLDNPITTDITTFKFNISFNDIMPFVNSRLINSQTNCWNDTCRFTFGDVGSFFFFSHAKKFIDITRCFTSSFLTFTLCCQFFFSHI